MIEGESELKGSEVKATAAAAGAAGVDKVDRGLRGNKEKHLGQVGRRRPTKVAWQLGQVIVGSCLVGTLVAGD